MNALDLAIISTLVYYDLLARPLTELEIYKYLLGQSQEVSFFDFKKVLVDLTATKKIFSKQGLFFLSGREQLIKTREKRLKLSQLKWKKLKKLAHWLALVPFVKMITVTGSLTAYNARPESDLDLLIVASAGRLWLTRTFVTALTGLLGIRRHGNLTKDRICLNCYLTENALEINEQAKPHDIHSAQEYGRLSLLLETKTGLYEKFINTNAWLKDYLAHYPWPAQQASKKIKINPLITFLRQMTEMLLSGKIGEWLEKRLGAWQAQRIKRKSANEPADQIFVSQNCLMLHPQSKSYELLKNFEEKTKSFMP